VGDSAAGQVRLLGGVDKPVGVPERSGNRRMGPSMQHGLGEICLRRGRAGGASSNPCAKELCVTQGRGWLQWMGAQRRRLCGPWW